MYFKNADTATFTVEISNAEIASCKVDGKTLKFTGLKEGQTPATVKCSDGTSQSFTITVRNSANGNGWL